MPALSSDYIPKISASKLTSTLRFAVSRGFFYQIAGDTGVGKTEIVLQACSTVTPEMLASHPSTAMGHKPVGVSVLYIMCSNYDEWTLRGVQSFADETLPDGSSGTVTVTAMPEWFRAYKILRAAHPDHVIVIFLDEIAVGVMQMQASLLQLITQKAINEQEIPDDEKPLVSFLSAYNRPEDYPAAYNMTAPLAMRAHGAFALEPNVQDWFDFMDARALQHPIVYDTLTKNPEFFHTKDIDDPSFEVQEDRYNGPTNAPKIAVVNAVKPRNWTQICEVCHRYFADRDMFGIDDSDLLRMFQARVPKDIATALMASYKVVGELTSIEDIQRDPDNCAMPDSLLMQTLQLYNLMGQMDAGNIDQVIVFMNRMNETVKGVITTKVLAARKTGVKSNLSSRVISKLLTSFLGQTIDNQTKLRGGKTDEAVAKRMAERSQKTLSEARAKVDDMKNQDRPENNPDLEIEI